MRASPFVLAALLLAACGGGGDAPTPEPPGTPAPAATDLSPFELEHGIGPVTEPVTLAEFDDDLAEEGEELFETKCSACHKLGERYVGPALGDVLERRSPAFVLNMILNPQEMYERHPVAKQLLAEYLSFMPNQALTREQARAVLEYLRPEGHREP